MSFLGKLVPAPLTSAALWALWLVLAREVSVGQVLLGLGLAVLLPLLTATLRPRELHVRRPLVVARFIMTVVHDVVLSNAHVAWGVLRWRWRPAQARFVVVPLELRAPVGLAVLAIVTTVVPGTVWSELALDRSALLLHVWDVTAEEDFVARYKARYEKPLREIFE